LESGNHLDRTKFGLKQHDCNYLAERKGKRKRKGKGKRRRTRKRKHK